MNQFSAMLLRLYSFCPHVELDLRNRPHISIALFAHFAVKTSTVDARPDVIHDPIRRHAILRQRITIAYRDAVVGRALAIDGNRERRPRLIQAAIALPDRAAVIEERVHTGAA